MRGWTRGAGIFLASRIGVLLVVVALAYNDHTSVGRLLASWDSKWYLLAAAHGYPAHIPTGHGNAAQSTLGFFPLLPALIRGVAVVTRLPVEGSGLVVTAMAGLAASVACWHLLRDLTDADGADRGTALVVFSPAAFVLSMVYGEGLLITFGALTLMALRRGRFAVAGICAGLASATDPIGIALLAPCLVAALRGIRRGRDWRPLLSVGLAPWGVIAFFSYLWAHDGTPFAWFVAQRRGWQSGRMGTGIYLIYEHLFEHGFTNVNDIVKATSTIVVVAILVVFLRGRPPAEVVAYVAVVCFLAALSPIIGFSPRIALRAFPLLGVFGAGLSRRVFVIVFGLSALALSTLIVLSLGTAPIRFTP